MARGWFGCQVSGNASLHNTWPRFILSTVGAVDGEYHRGDSLDRRSDDGVDGAHKHRGLSLWLLPVFTIAHQIQNTTAGSDRRLCEAMRDLLRWGGF